MKKTEIIKCCRNCRNLIESPRNNRYNDVDHFCIVTGYLTTGIDRDITKIKRYSPGGKELECEWEEKKMSKIAYTTEETKLIKWNERRQIEKKVLPEFYKGIRTHKKMFEIRKDEDNIQPGDILVLREWDGEKYTGGKTRREVTCVLRNAPGYGLMDGYCILSLQTPGWDYLRAQACLDGEESEEQDDH